MANKTNLPGLLNTVSLSYRPSRLLSTEEERLVMGRSEVRHRKVASQQMQKELNEDLFSDLRMKGERANTLQQTKFARLRLKVYRRIKREPVLASSPPSQEPPPPPRLHKTSFRCRVYRQPIRYPTQSSSADPQSTPLPSPQLPNPELKQQKPRMVSSLMVQPPPSLKTIKILQVPMRAAGEDEKKEQIIVRHVDKDKKREMDLFEAWESFDIFGSNKGGIVEYTETVVQPSRQEQTSRRRFLIGYKE